ncbi:hypothetical protein QJS04_geneDACA004368 [Acorus gramineus]|uniref:Uncharacterized protein n=1 Tax=Acorus gramineus TaxID=55184 RepID=A0AAV9B4D1_ACOGR|nr:hypothetical protein QJS04_geneDACA004368 [Acorus gramineus]
MKSAVMSLCEVKDLDYLARDFQDLESRSTIEKNIMNTGTTEIYFQDGTVIRGQNEISHPTNESMRPIIKEHSSVPTLPSRIKRVFYLSSEGCKFVA